MAQEMHNGMDKHTLKKMDQDHKLDVIIDYLFSIDERIQTTENNRNTARVERQEYCQQQHNICDSRFKKIERLHYGIIGVLLVLNVIVPAITVFWQNM